MLIISVWTVARQYCTLQLFYILVTDITSAIIFSISFSGNKGFVHLTKGCLMETLHLFATRSAFIAFTVSQRKIFHHL